MSVPLVQDHGRVLGPIVRHQVLEQAEGRRESHHVQRMWASVQRPPPTHLTCTKRWDRSRLLRAAEQVDSRAPICFRTQAQGGRLVPQLSGNWTQTEDCGVIQSPSSQPQSTHPRGISALNPWTIVRACRCARLPSSLPLWVVGPFFSTALPLRSSRLHNQVRGSGYLLSFPHDIADEYLYSYSRSISHVGLGNQR
jgi:hypothetical protein